MAAQADEVAISEPVRARRAVSLRDPSACTFLSRNEVAVSVRRKSACGVAVLAAALSLATLASAGGAVGNANKTCGNVSGPHWSIGGRSGTQYVVSSPNGALLSGAQLGSTTGHAALLTVEFPPQRAAWLGLCRNIRLSSRRLLRSEEQSEGIRLGADGQVAVETL